MIAFILFMTMASFVTLVCIPIVFLVWKESNDWVLYSLATLATVLAVFLVGLLSIGWYSVFRDFNTIMLAQG